MKKSLDSEEPEAAAWPNDGMLHGLRQALQGFKKKNQELLAENVALKKGLANTEPCWEREKKKLLDERDSLVSTLSMARNDLGSLAEELKSVRAEHQKCETERDELDNRLQERETEVLSLRKSLHLQKNETKIVKRLWKAERDEASNVMLSIEKSLLESNAQWKQWWFVRQEEVATELHTLQAHYEKKVSDLTKEKFDAVTGVLTQALALLQDSMTRFASIKTEIQQREAEWENKNRTLEDRLRYELLAKENIFRQIEELQKQSKEHEAKLTEEWMNKEREMKEEMRLLQELALKTDKEKAKMREQEKKEKKETEKRMKREGGRKEMRGLASFLFS
ncbi:vicilin-like seed storage protein At2g18540 [Mugil cephalus]|uniref:vicilin-like seed storage protein At2g18540 n=1 Tax=Mugil cephalus TaxID=48193 RepID=UPI001FB65A4E|nr:vicilin-like seed storage protein At2g18540 [Mugil cephalus]